MTFISVFNDVLGPVMRGPSSSHTAGSHRLGRIARSLLGEEPASAVFTFDPEGSYARTYREQGADLGFTAGLLGWPITDERFPQALEMADRAGIKIEFKRQPLPLADHPNTVLIELLGRGKRWLRMSGQSVGGGLVVVRRVDDWDVEITGKTHDTLVICGASAIPGVKALAGRWKAPPQSIKETVRGDGALLHFQGRDDPGGEKLNKIRNLDGVHDVLSVPPIFFVQRGEPLFSSGAEMIAWAESRRISLGRTEREYESRVLGFSEKEAEEEMLRRWDIMAAAIERGMKDRDLKLKLLRPAAAGILEAETGGKLALGGPATRAAARALAVLHVSNSGGVVCAAPTGASSGVIPGVLATLAETKKLSSERIALALFAAGAVGLVIAARATFAAEVAGCQVEIGAAGAMAAAAAVETMGGTARQALDAAAIALQNSMGSVCDLVQGLCEIPCHTRNAAAAASALVCADLILGGYVNPVPLDETVDAAFAVGKMMPRELRCTSLGGLALAPSAQALRSVK
ncbi:MAG: L-serine ammonia-lyase, iron-sulfur-dependent, subunit alpha [Candidatus Aminicenantes bacterium]|nr:L-serine ammonia-lyase, iron-sulfur-dependent, subunit alpha [Candidatus Aminicenantes bacterium]